MSISAVGSASAPPVSSPPSGSEKAEARGPDHDKDADNAKVSAPVQSKPAPGTGGAVNKTA